ncbi:ABC transporter permease [Dictyobacter arantiisoli]|uniref:Uncharacterized protein n=1 Tax=Dictyobacter arantiisoli TaxID=2014874 RepID=A0A5A5TCI4_9CHLR|nr:ABC transporter permease [Dictyobacter arantiisoli]GCF08743.1 hypothetical protein KDI_23070 [Dictyobacter arantiisoli]
MARDAHNAQISVSHAQTIVQGWWPQTWQLIRWYFFVLRRRLMTKVVLWIFFGLYVLILVLTIFSHLLLKPARSAPSAADPIGILTFPGSLQFALALLGLLGPLLLCIVASMLVGSDYVLGMHRQMLTRGMSRAQVFIAQIVTLALVALGFVGVTFLIAIVLGLLIGPLFGYRPQLLPWAGWLGIILTWLTQSLRFFVYMSIAVLAATCGRSATVGIIFSLGYIVVEYLATTVVFSIIGGLSAQIGSALAALINALPGVVSNTLNGYTTSLIVGQGIVSWDRLPLQLFLTLAYIIILLGASYLIYNTSDISD